jgi:hypothetical protein
LVLFKCAQFVDKVWNDDHANFLSSLLDLKTYNFPKRFLRSYVVKLYWMNAWYLFHYVVCNNVTKLLLTFGPERFLSLSCLNGGIFRYCPRFWRFTREHRRRLNAFFLFLVLILSNSAIIRHKVAAVEVSSDLSYI